MIRSQTMPMVFVQGTGCHPEYCHLDRIPVHGESIELADGTFAQVTSVTHTPHRHGLDAVLTVGAIEDENRRRSELYKIELALQPRS